MSSDAKKKPPHKHRRKRRRVQKWEKGPKRDEFKQDKTHHEFTLTDMSNEKFEQYYKAQQVVPEGEWDEFMAALRRDLPTTFRINPLTGFDLEILKRLRGPCFGLREHKVVFQGEVIAPPEPLPWYPGERAWYYKLSRRHLRREDGVSQWRDFLIVEDGEGNINRQEAVSMIPPLLLEVQSHHMVLDMCAAPGSKTAQLISALHMNGDTIVPHPKGVVFANDMDPKRAYMLVHRLKRLPSANYLVSCNEGQCFPTLFAPTEVASTVDAKSASSMEVDGTSTLAARSSMQPLKFDRILCDVPCSGDGTLRKNIDVWKSWSVQGGLGLHRLQLVIASRGIRMLKAGGLMVYSTCSLNPLEDEAVVAHLLRTNAGFIELVDISAKLPGLKRTTGKSTWQVYDTDGTLYSTFKEVPQQRTGKFVRSLFPPTPEEAEGLHLDRCIRVLPHQQDTGGFFVALLRRVPLSTATVSATTSADVPESKEADITAPVEDKTADDDAAIPNKELTDLSALAVDEEGGDKPPPRNSHGRNDREEQPERFDFNNFQPVDQATLTSLCEFYGLDETFPSKCLFARSEVSKKRIYFLAPSIAPIIVDPQNRKLKLVHTGVRMFERNTKTSGVSDYRIAQEAVFVLIPFVKKQLVRASLKDFVTLLLSKENVKLDDLPEALRQALQPIAVGGGLVLLDHVGVRVPVGMSIWRARWSVSVLITKPERRSIATMLSSAFPDLVPPILAELPAEAQTIVRGSLHKKRGAAVLEEESKTNDAGSGSDGDSKPSAPAPAASSDAPAESAAHTESAPVTTHDAPPRQD